MISEALRYDLRLALRNLGRRAGVSGIIVLTLAVGIACTTSMFTVVRGVLLRPLPWPDSDRLAVIWNLPPGMADPLHLSQREIRDLQDLLDGLRVGSYESEETPLRFGDRTEAVTATWVTREVIEMVGAEPLLGRGFGDDDYRLGGLSSVILSHEAWQRLFGGDEGAVGATIELGGRAREVIGVMPPSLPLPLEVASGERTQAWIGTTLGYANDWPRETRMFPALARLEPGTSWAHARGQLERALETLRARHGAAYPDGWRMRLVPVADEILGSVRPALWALFGAVFFVLAIACANVAHLLLAQGDARRGDLAVRSALGARRGRLVRQLMLENLLLALAGGVLGTVGAYAAVDALLALRPGQLPRLDAVSLDATVLLFGVAGALLTALAFGLPPALRSVRGDLRSALYRARGDGGLRGRRGRRMLVVGEIALATVLLTGAGLLIASLMQLARADLGFAPDGLVAAGISASDDTARSSDDLLRFWDRVRERAAAVPGVEAASLTMSIPLYTGVLSRAMEVEGGASGVGSLPRVTIERAAPAIAATMGYRLVRGRDLREEDRADSQPVALVNATLARWLERDALGRRLRVVEGDRPWLTVVGVVADAVHEGVDAPVAPRVIVPYTQFPATGHRMQPFMWLALRSTTASEATLAGAAEAVAAVDPGATVLRTLVMDDHVTRSAFARYRFAAFTLGLFAAVAVALAVVGVYGLLAYLVAGSRHEVGVRIAVGARKADIYRLVGGQGLVMALAGLAIGIPTALALTRVIESMLYGVAATEPLAFAATALVLLAAATWASLAPARKATQVDPIEVLRSE